MQVNLNQLDIPKASAYAMQALDIVTGETPDFKQLEQAIMHDPLLASSVLRYANSPLHRRATEITNVPTALKLLGLNSIKSAIVTATIRSLLPVDSHIGQTLLQHMLDVSILCKLIGRQCCPADADDLEFLGLIHDVGMLTLAANYERTYDRLVHDAREQNIGIDQLEIDEFGVTHDTVTQKTIDTFRLPKRYGELLKNFHTREAVSGINASDDRDRCVLSLAHTLLDDMERACFPERMVESRSELCALLQLSEEQLQSFQHTAGALLENS